MIWLPLAIGSGYLFIPLLGPFVYPFGLLLILLPLTLIVATAKTPRENILALKLTSYSALLYAILLALGLAKPF
jgi:1,4-dihydroxy-2-naphthoate octaprenyltransferase